MLSTANPRYPNANHHIDTLVRGAREEGMKAWIRLPVSVVVSGFLFTFVGVAQGAAWLTVVLALEIAGAVVRTRLAGGDLSYRGAHLVCTAAITLCWVAHALMLWGRPDEVARIGALMDLFTLALYGAIGGHKDVRTMVVLLGPPLVALPAILLHQLWTQSPPLTAAFASLATLGACATIVANAVAMHLSDKAATGLTETLQAERDTLEDRVRDRTRDLETAMHAARAANVAKSQFLAVMSHELRTPLNAVIGYAEMLQEDLAADTALARPDDAGQIASSGRHLLSMINDILDLTKIDAGKMEVHPERVDVRAVLEDVASKVAHLAKGNGNRVTVVVATDAAAFVTDQRKLSQSVLNLAANACKFTTAGAVTLDARVRTVHGAPWLAVTISDTGCGMAPELMDRLFQPFVQADSSATRRYAGTGLGLAITKRFVEIMGGQVELRSTPGVGTTVTLLAPELLTAPALLAGAA